MYSSGCEIVGIMLRDRCWPTTFHTRTTGDAEGMVSEWPVWSAPHTHGNFKLERLMILNLWYTNSIIGQEIRACPSLLYTRPWVPWKGIQMDGRNYMAILIFHRLLVFKIDTKNVFVTRSFLSELAIFFIVANVCYCREKNLSLESLNSMIVSRFQLSTMVACQVDVAQSCANTTENPFSSLMLISNGLYNNKYHKEDRSYKLKATKSLLSLWVKWKIIT